jgi:hypothetical protein
MGGAYTTSVTLESMRVHVTACLSALRKTTYIFRTVAGESPIRAEA